MHGASRPRLVSVITSIDSKGNLGFVPSPSPRACTLSAFDWEASCDHQAAALKHQLFARNCSKCFIYMSRLALPDRYYDSILSEETDSQIRELKKMSKVTQLARVG